MGGRCWSVELISKEGDGWQLLVRRAHKCGRGWVDVAGL